MRIIYLGYEIASRETTSLLYIGTKLLNRGLVDKVVIANILILKALFRFRLLPSGFWFHKSAQVYNYKFLKSLKKRGFINLLQDAEAISDLFEDNIIDCYMKPIKSLEYIDFVLAATQEEEIAINDLDTNTIVRNTGFIRFWPLADKKYTNYLFKEEISDIKSKYGKHILYLSSATSLRYHFCKLTKEEIYKQLRTNDGMSESHTNLLMEWAEYGQYSLFNVLEFIRLLHERYDNNIAFIYRCHPSENSQFFEELFSGIPFVYVQDNFNLHSSILAANAIICSTLSTTIFDSYYLHKIPEVLAPYSSSKFYSKLLKHKSFNISKLSTSAEELLCSISSKLDFVNSSVSVDDFNKSSFKFSSKEFINSSPDDFLNSFEQLFSSSVFKQNHSLKRFFPVFLYIFGILFDLYIKLFSHQPHVKYASYKSRFNYLYYVFRLRNVLTSLNFSIFVNSVIIYRKKH